MNKLIVLLLAGLLCISRQNLQAQVSNTASLLNVHNMGADAAAVKASRDFWQKAGEGMNEQWFKLREGYEANYSDGDTKGRYVYDKHGNWVYSILTYGEEKMPEDVRQLVRSTWFDFGITWVKEVRQAQDLVYVVHMENDKAWKEVAVQEGEMRELKSFCK